MKSEINKNTESSKVKQFDYSDKIRPTTSHISSSMFPLFLQFDKLLYRMYFLMTVFCCPKGQNTRP